MGNRGRRHGHGGDGDAVDGVVGGGVLAGEGAADDRSDSAGAETVMPGEGEGETGAVHAEGIDVDLAEIATEPAAEPDAGLVQNDDQLTPRTEAEIDSHLAAAIEDEARRLEAEKAAGQRVAVIHPAVITRGNYLDGAGEMSEVEMRTELARLGDPIAASKAAAEERKRVHAESRAIIEARRAIDGEADGQVRKAQEFQQWALERIRWIEKALKI